MKNEVELEAVVWHPYGTGYREIGERYFATQADAEVLVSLGRAKLAKRSSGGDEAARPAATKAASKTGAKSKR